ncbi:LysR family transcriptional regulator [Thalassotalea insulae]|uniref:LysR family transcriptional regulator n=1 Tax=Thalassotalea insulae TaxID=2056778 RepID=A0ABQ6GVS2_9GAMM|nr:LysR family transcriptional regulator [Thalassotalea insulae]GLX78276.1 LysR family transcriptional regulator [Thalassotalea insulae]
MRPPLKAIQCFDAVARLNSFSKAAEELHVTQSAVSHQVKQLEEYLNASLFIRQGRTFSLSDVGQTYYQEVSHALGAISNASRMVREGTSGNIRMALYSSLAVKWLIPRLDDFRKRYPHIELTVNMITDDVECHDRIADCFITVNPPRKGYLHKVLYQEKLIPVCSQQLWKTIKTAPLPEAMWQQTLLSAQYFGVNKALNTDWLRWCDSAGFTLPPETKICHFSHVLLANEAAKYHMGIMLMDSMLLSIEDKEAGLVQVHQHALITGDNYYFVYKNSQANNSDMKVLEQWLIEQCKK